MNKKNQKLGLAAVVLAIFFMTLLVTLNVRLYGDDYHYIRFTSGSLKYFFERHYQHYFLANGRVIVHLLDTLFLSASRLVWAVFNSAMLAGIVYFGSLAVTVRRAKAGVSYGGAKDLLVPGIFMSIAILFLDPLITRQSVYWITGSFNYVYPLFMLMVYWSILSKAVAEEGYPWYLPLVALFASASVEQAGLMTFGLTLMTVLELVFIQKKKPNKVLILALTASLVGVITIVCSPAVRYRASMEDKPAEGMLNIIKHNVISQSNTFLFSKMMAPYHLAAMVTSLFVVIKQSEQLRGSWRYIERLIIFAGLCSSVLWFWQTASGRAFSTTYRLEVLFKLAILFGYGILLLYAALIAYTRKLTANSTLPLIAVVLCFGSQIMMLVSPVYGFRNLLFAIVPLVLLVMSFTQSLKGSPALILYAGLISFLLNEPVLLCVPAAALLVYSVKSKKERRYRQYADLACILAVLLVSMSVFVPTVRGYADNAKVFDSNMDAALEYKLAGLGDTLTQRKLPHEHYAWVMPYHAEYYEVYYNLFLGIGEKTDINWTD